MSDFKNENNNADKYNSLGLLDVAADKYNILGKDNDAKEMAMRIAEAMRWTNGIYKRSKKY